MEVQILIETPT